MCLDYVNKWGNGWLRNDLKPLFNNWMGEIKKSEIEKEMVGIMEKWVQIGHTSICFWHSTFIGWQHLS